LGSLHILLSKLEIYIFKFQTLYTHPTIHYLHEYIFLRIFWTLKIWLLYIIEKHTFSCRPAFLISDSISTTHLKGASQPVWIVRIEENRVVFRIYEGMSKNPLSSSPTHGFTRSRICYWTSYSYDMAHSYLRYNQDLPRRLPDKPNEHLMSTKAAN
jgi:hypothetical protein